MDRLSSGLMDASPTNYVEGVFESISNITGKTTIMNQPVYICVVVYFPVQITIF